MSEAASAKPPRRDPTALHHIIGDGRLHHSSRWVVGAAQRHFVGEHVPDPVASPRVTTSVFPFECNIIPIHPGYTNNRHAPHTEYQVLTRGEGSGRLERAAFAGLSRVPKAQDCTMKKASSRPSRRTPHASHITLSRMPGPRSTVHADALHARHMAHACVRAAAGTLCVFPGAGLLSTGEDWCLGRSRVHGAHLQVCHLLHIASLSRSAW